MFALRFAPTAALAAALALLGPAAVSGVSPFGSASAQETVDPRAGDPTYERGRRMFGAIRGILDEAARERLDSQVDPNGPISDLFWRQFGMDSDSRVSELLGSAFELMTDAPVVEMRDRIARARDQIDLLESQIAELREQRIAAPEDLGWSSWLGVAEDRDTLTDAIEELEARVEGQQDVIEQTKRAFGDAMAAVGAPLPDDQIDLLFDSVTGGDVVELAAAYEAVRGVSEQLRALMDESGEDLEFARRYYGMHTALIALLVEAQTRFLTRIDEDYLPRLEAIEGDILATAADTEELLAQDPTDAQRRALLANRRSQIVARDALQLYRDYLLGQRDQIAEARERTLQELRVADNTLRTVDASYQLRELMESAAASFEALQSLESPGFERLFNNDELRREFQELTDRLGPAS